MERRTKCVRKTKANKSNQTNGKKSKQTKGENTKVKPNKSLNDLIAAQLKQVMQRESEAKEQHKSACKRKRTQKGKCKNN